MKKLIAIAVVFALVAGAAFAQVSVGGWGRAVIVPLRAVGPSTDARGEVGNESMFGTKDQGEVYTGIGPGWYPNGTARVGVNINGTSDFVGFNVAINAENGIGLGDFACIWAKPFGSDILKLTAGFFLEDALRGKFADFSPSGFSDFTVGGGGEDGIFARFGTAGENKGWGGKNSQGAGFMISSAPIEGLFIGFLVTGDFKDGGTTAREAFQYSQFGVGFNIANIGHIRAQYLGGWGGLIDTNSDSNYLYTTWRGFSAHERPARIEAAFALTAVEGLLVDLGAKFWLPVEEKAGSASTSTEWSKGMDVALGVSYNAGDFGIGFRFDLTGIGAYNDTPRQKGSGVGDQNQTDGVAASFHLVPTYAIGDVTIGLDFGLKLTDDGAKANGDSKKTGTSQLGFGVFAKKGLGSGMAMIGLAYKTPTYNSNTNDGASELNGKPEGIGGQFAIPIVLEYWF